MRRNLTPTNQTFQANGIIFDYPSKWKSVNETIKFVIGLIIDPKEKISGKKPDVVVQISKKRILWHSIKKVL